MINQEIAMTTTTSEQQYIELYEQARQLICDHAPEAMNAVRHAIEQNISVPVDELRRVTAQLLGFTRRGAKVDALTDRAIAALLSQHVVVEGDGRITLA